MTVQVSRLIRLALMDRMQTYNDLLAEACQEFQVKPYRINFDQVDYGNTDLAPQNFYEGNRTLAELSLYLEPDFPALTFWTGEGGELPPGQRNQGILFSGWVAAHWRFFLSVKGLRSRGLVDLQEATQSAMIAMLDDEFGGFNYRGDLAWQAPPEQVWLDQDSNHVGFIQEIEFSGTFEVNVT